MKRLYLVPLEFHRIDIPEGTEIYKIKNVSTSKFIAVKDDDIYVKGTSAGIYGL